MKRSVGIANSSILIVDDTPENLRLLAEILAKRGGKVRPARSGRTALESVKAARPDLILLDILMPEMDGYEVCRLLKADNDSKDIPVIFITALNETNNKLRAFSMGGVDYIVKPFQVDEVIARVETHLALQQTRRELEAQIAELNAFAHTVAHDLKNPLSIISGFADALVDTFDTMETTELAEYMEGIQRTAHKAINITDELLLLASVRRADVEFKPLDMAEIVTSTLARLEHMVSQYQAHITVPETWPVAYGYAPWVEEVWANYLSNAMKYGGTPPNLQLGARDQGNGMVRLWVTDNGPGILPDEQKTLFAEFARLSKARAKGHGLGLSIVRRVVQRLGGQVGVDSQPNQGSTFYFTLPNKLSAADNG
jgi:signal transduction histidine kinase